VITRTAKALLLAGIALFYTLVVFNNLTDFHSNYEFVHHVLLMDSTFPGNHGMWRSISSPTLYLAFYWSIIAWEIVTTILLWWGVAKLVEALRRSSIAFNTAKRISIAALTVSLLMWLVAFHAIGGEWFLMWQSHTWNGQEDSFKNFVEVGLVLLILIHPETETQP
jgi:predicted small integral membrane protein